MRTLRALVVDDNPINIDLAAFVLRAQGFVVEGAEGALQALACAQSFQPDVILMDIQMPGIDGLEAVQRLRQAPSTKHIVIIAFTAYAMKGDDEKMRAAGCDGYIPKPIDVATFGQTVRDHLASRGIA